MQFKVEIVDLGCWEISDLPKLTSEDTYTCVVKASSPFSREFVVKAVQNYCRELFAKKEYPLTWELAYRVDGNQWRKIEVDTEQEPVFIVHSDQEVER